MNRYLLSTCLLALLLIISSCGPKPQATPIIIPISTEIPSGTGNDHVTTSTGPIPIIYDDDGSPDGTTALLYFLSHPQADVKAVNISYGEAHPEIYVQHLGRMMSAYGIEGVPLGYGQDAPMSGTNGFPEGVRQDSGNFWGFPILNPDKTYPSQPAPELMVSTINQSPTPVTIFVSGPFTNLAQALQLDPNIKNNIAAVYMMGGAVYAAGNVADFYPEDPNKVAEWNIFADIEAADIVFESGLDLHLVPLDATNQVLITNQDTGQWRQGGGLADFSADMYDMLMNAWSVKNVPVWDLMTAVIALEPDHCKFTQLHMQVITEQGNKSGQTAIKSGEVANISVCLEPDVNRIKQTLIDIYSGSTLNVIPTVEPTPVPTPAGQIFHDDFSGSLQPGWIWENEVSMRWSLSADGWLEILGEDASLIMNDMQTNLLCRTAPEGDIQITVHLSANPGTNFQQATLYLYRDGDNYIAMNRGFCGFCLEGGNGVYMEYKLAGSVGTYKVPTRDTDVFLRLVMQEQSITGYYAFEPDEWQQFGRIGNYLKDTRICLGVSNVDSPGEYPGDLSGRFDYLDISQP